MQRVQTRAQFQLILGTKPLARSEHFALHGAGAEILNGLFPSKSHSGYGDTKKQGEMWVGAMVPKRWAKRAVTRNTIKRQIYSLSSELEASLPMTAQVIRLRKSFEPSQFKSAGSEQLKTAVRKELKSLFETMPRNLLPEPK